MPRGERDFLVEFVFAIFLFLRKLRSAALNGSRSMAI